jgi:predicted RNase H-like HicB family nuclease
MVFYKAIFEKGNGNYGVSFPALDGCFSGGDTFEEAYFNAQEALGLYITTLEVDGEKVPQDISEDEVETGENEIMAIISCELKKYRPKKAVKKTLTIPYWLNVKAEENHINFSGVLQEALKERLDV